MLRSKLLGRSLCLMQVYGPNSNVLHPDFVEEISDALRKAKLIIIHDRLRLQSARWERRRGMEGCGRPT